jgi:ABC-type transport system involved in multi-copper enzyme maturation permease subunit
VTVLPLFYARSIGRGRWIWVGLAAFALAAAVVALLGIGSFRQLGVGQVSPAAVALLDLAILLPTLQACLIAALTLTGDREGGLLAMLRARGASPLGIAAAVWVAASLSAAAMLLTGFGVVAVIIAGAVPLEDMATFLGLLAVGCLVAAITAAVGVLIGAAVRTRLQASLLAVLAWFVLAIGIDLLVVGLGAFLRAGEPALVAAIVASPLQAGRIVGLLLIDPAGAVLGPLGAWILAAVGREGAIVLLAVGLGLWILVPLLVAGRLLRTPG